MPTFVILLLDAGFIAVAVEFTSWLVGRFFFEGADVGFRGITVSATIGLLAGLATSYLTGLHQTSMVLQRKEVAMRSVVVGSATALGVLLASHFVWYQALGRTVLLLVAASSAAAVLSWRLVYARYLERGPRIRIAVLGDGPAQRELAAQIHGVAHARYDVVGLIGDGASEGGPAPVLGPADQAVALCLEHDVEVVMVVSSSAPDGRDQHALADLRVHGFEIKTAEALLMALQQRVPIDMVDERWLLHLFEQLDHGRDRLKRVLDVVVAALGLAVLVTLLPGLYLLVRLDSRGPLFYSQTRVGLGNRPFRLFKIRTMKVAPPNADEQWAQRGDDRTTAIGRLLRLTRIDEMPQFWNVLRGDMSIVGPRPEQPGIAKELEDQISYFSYRHLVKPGITGWAQIHHGYADSVDGSRTKLAYDLFYVRHHTLVLDIDIMLRTFFVMAARIGSR